MNSSVDKISDVIRNQRHFAVFPMVCADHCAHLANIEFSDAATNGTTLAEVLSYGFELYQYDMVLVFSDPYVEAQALGCPVELDPYPLLRGTRSGNRIDRTAVIINAADRLKTRLEVPVFASIKGPFTLAAFLGGIEHFLKSLLKKESEALDLLAEAMDFQLAYLDRLLSLGVNIFIGDPLASSSVISPEIFSKYAFDPLKRMVKKSKDRGVLVGVHICGDAKPITDDLDTLGADILSIEDIHVKSTTTRMGGVATQTILSGNYQRIESEVKSALTTGQPVILSTSCDVPPQTDPEHIKTMLHIAGEYDNR